MANGTDGGAQFAESEVLDGGTVTEYGGTITSLESDDLPIPDVSNASMATLTMPQEEYAEEEQEEQPQQQEKEFINPQARARVAQKQARQKTEELRNLEIKMDRMAEALSQLMGQGAEAQGEYEEGEDIDPEIDPVGFLSQQIQSIKTELQGRKEEAERIVQANAIRNAVNAADMSIRAKIQESPQENQAAVIHLARILDNNLQRRFPNYTSQERLSIAAEQIASMKAGWVARGINPGEEIINMAYQYGFNPAMIPQQNAPQAPGRAQRQQADPRAQVQQQRARQASSASIGGVDGRSPRRISGKEWKQMDEKTFNHTLNQLISAGQIKPGKGYGRTPSFSELLPGKGVMAQ